MILPPSLDLIFPYFVFAYGTLVITVLYVEPLAGLAETRLPGAVWLQLKSHRSLAWLSLIGGALWILQKGAPHFFLAAAQQ